MQRFIFIRHGETVLNALEANPAEALLYGAIETPLTKRGEQQAVACAELLQPMAHVIDCMVTSCLQRAVHTQQIITDALGLQVPIIRSSLLNERSLGDFEGVPVATILHDPLYGQGAKLSQFYRDFTIKAPNGENYTDVTKRVLQAFTAVSIKQPTATCIVFIAHGDVIRCLVGALLQLSEDDILSFSVQNCQPITIVHSHGQYTVETE